MRRAALLLLALAVAVTVTPALGRQAADPLTGRLATLGKVWLSVKFAHPRVALSDRDWDAVLDTALPAVKAATDDKTFAAAIDAMLATIGDPATRVMPSPEPPAGPVQRGVPPVFTALPSGALLIDVRAPGALAQVPVMRKSITDHVDAITQADRLVIDARGTRQSGRIGEQIFDMLNDLLVPVATALPTSRYVRHSGYRAQLGGASFYSSELVTEAAVRQEPRAGIGPRRTAFILDRQAIVPPIALALQASGLGAIVISGEPPELRADTDGIPLGGGAYAAIRTRDTVIDGRRIELKPDLTVAPSEADDKVYIASSSLIASPRPPVRGIEDPAPIWRADAAYAGEPFPTEAHRLLSVYRLWGVFDNFFPYKHLTDRPWEEALAAFIPRVLAAKTELEYVQVMSEMASRAQDSHVGVSGSRAMTAFMGEVGPPVFVRYVEGRPVITRILDGAPAPGFVVGDEILAVDGEDVTARAARLERYITYSTPAGRARVIEARLLNGDRGSIANVRVRGADGKTRDVQCPRTPPATPQAQRDGDLVRILEGNIGYADLERLEVGGVADMFERFRDTIGIIFDMRGYPRGTAWAIAPRINTRKPAFAAIFQRPMMTAGSTEERLTFTQPLPPTTTWVYGKPTVMLIDERAISQSEHTGLFFKAANNTTFVGSQTTGANGDVTTMVLPGGLRVSFTGHDVRWPDGHQLQRVGLVPDVPASPTIAGIRAGRDEVLEKAVAVLKSKRRPSQ